MHAGKTYKYNQIYNFLKRFKSKLQNLKGKMIYYNIMIFEKLPSVVATNNDVISLPQSLNTDILQHLRALDDELKLYFLEFNGNKFDLLPNPFRLPAEKVLDEYQDECLELRRDSRAKVSLMKNL